MSVKSIEQEAQTRMGKSVDSLKNELVKLRTGRAHPNLLEHITVDYYGTPTPLNQVANTSVLDPRTLSVTPWEKTMVQPIEKAIMNSDLGLNPATAGDVIRVPLPVLTEERRRDLVKIVKTEAENARIAVRNIRRDAISQYKELLKEKELTEDEAHRAEEAIQKVTDKFVNEIERIVSHKETELMEV